MTKIQMLLATLLAFGSINSVNAADRNYTYDQLHLQAYNNQLLQEVRNQEQLVESLQNDMARTDTVQLQSGVSRYSNAVSMLDVKRILVNNFIGTPALQSATVRDLLLQVLKQELITPGDLAHLQSVVNSEKARLQLNQPPPANPPAQTQTTTPPSVGI